MAILEPDTQWLFPLSAFQHTPSWELTRVGLDYELKERVKGVEFIFRVAAQLKLGIPVFSAASQYFHRFYMRYSVAEYTRQDVAAASLFLACKTEEHSRKLKDVAYICFSKATGETDENSPEIPRWQKTILATEEVLLEALCFDFIVDHPHAELASLLLHERRGELLEQYAWTIVTDSLRTPLCLLQPGRIIAAGCFILAEKLFDGPNSASLDERIFSRPSASLPTPPHLYAQSPKSDNAAQMFFNLSDEDMEAVAVTITMLLDLYSAFAAMDENFSHLSPITEVSRPSLSTPYQTVYTPDPRTQANNENNGDMNDGAFTPASMARTPSHHFGGETQTSTAPSTPSVQHGTTTPKEPPAPEPAQIPKPPQRGPLLDLS
ncbi:hypothetical protein M422DRAFT_228474 [Sphaerobolus stellatus SS14]|uniref:Cyclin-like domain-containing protein n=1 Tax=Sphaerobolus stellatus (strain SS14) TaxID=990650 RepID=A0A0C9VBM6_SPHS4|nr:hypothetical protein M422DRAFT_228474 [Sphaerobolus stellatus SS14]